MREKILNWTGVGLIGICFLLSLGRILLARKQSENEKVIRIAHVQLEGGVRSAFDKMAAEYTRLHPGVKIVQIPIPQGIFTNWLITQLVGGTAPDLIEMSNQTEDQVIRYFYPFSDTMNAPNPYNAGTELEGVPLRLTMFDGGAACYNSQLLEYFGVSISGFTTRAYYNVDLLRKVTGSDKIPKTYEEFLSACKKVSEYSTGNGRTLIPVAGSKYNGPMIMDQLFSSQTQKLLASLMPPAYASINGPRVLDGYLHGKWSLQSPEIVDAANLMRDVAGEMQPGFMQVRREDAMFYFVQGRALCYVSGSWDATSIRSQVSFPVGIGEIPLPSKSDPTYGRNIFGSFSEAGTNAGIEFGITRNSAHPEIARDFLLFITGKRMQELWTKESGWIPAVTGVTPSPEARPFMPVTDGYLPGFTLKAPGGADVYRIIDNNFYLLTSPFGGAQAFLQAIKPEYDKALISDLQRACRIQMMSIRRMDGIFCGLAWKAAAAPEDAAAAKKYDLLIQGCSARDRSYYLNRLMLLRSGNSVE